MTQDNKDILFKDLCARIPYGVKVNCGDCIFTFDEMHMGIGMLYTDFNRQKLDSPKIILSGCYYGENIKPYLFPMSSMTEQQRKEFVNTLDKESNYGWTINTFDWCNKNHFDYRNLIPMNIAIDATNLDIY